MPVAATSRLSLPLVAVADAIAASSAWTAFGGAADSVYVGEAPIDHASPCCLVDWDNGISRTATDVQAGSLFQQDGQIVVGVRWRVPGLSDRDARVTFDNGVGGLLDALEIALPAILAAIGAVFVGSTFDAIGRTDPQERAAGEDWIEVRWLLSVRTWGGP